MGSLRCILFALDFIPVVCWLMPTVVMGLLFLYIEGDA